MAKIKRVQPIKSVAKTQEQKLQEAAELIHQNRIERENAFNKQLSELMQKYGVEIIPQIIIKAK